MAAASASFGELALCCGFSTDVMTQCKPLDKVLFGFRLVDRRKSVKERKAAEDCIIPGSYGHSEECKCLRKPQLSACCRHKDTQVTRSICNDCCGVCLKRKQFSGLAQNSVCPRGGRPPPLTAYSILKEEGPEGITEKFGAEEPRHSAMVHGSGFDPELRVVHG
ncbi:hypothetical protein KOW79_002833 [Hemibagrus wyckioides]|uniref:Uncharacterized protein n=1 Tax=Hemibagrus wyckioides TaxID=337641 RepID=A0A9D3P5F1_9TELE|nr:hypothetical protein KOW79_002833 [Hemibagrus wyckioides]